MSMLDVRDLSCGYGGTPVLRDVSFRVDAGEMLGVIGPNGCGKTTLLRAVSGVLRRSAGDVRLDGRSLDAFSRRALARRVACVSQDVIVDFSFEVREIAAMGRAPYINRFGWETAHDRAVVERALVQADVGHLADRVLTDLSGGERQRAFIAMALAQEPRLLLLDEPTSHLDINHQIAILDIVRGLNREQGVTVLMVSHDLNLAAEYCGRLLMLRGGEVAHRGTPDEVLTQGNIRDVYGAEVRMETNPATGRPHVILIPGAANESARTPPLDSS